MYRSIHNTLLLRTLFSNNIIHGNDVIGWYAFCLWSPTAFTKLSAVHTTTIISLYTVIYSEINSFRTSILLSIFGSIFPYWSPVSGGEGDTNNHSIKGTTLEISACAFVCSPCFMIIDHEAKGNQSINQCVDTLITNTRKFGTLTATSSHIFVLMNTCFYSAIFAMLVAGS